jgi:hypothetical protein
VAHYMISDDSLNSKCCGSFDKRYGSSLDRIFDSSLTENVLAQLLGYLMADFVV